jgi:hypothetical protein
MMIGPKSIPKTPYAPADSDLLHTDIPQQNKEKKKHIL